MSNKDLKGGALVDLYFKTFPEATFFDSRAMAEADYDRFDDLMREALDRGFQVSTADLEWPPAEPDPESGLVF
jgi:hypothetical protein